MITVNIDGEDTEVVFDKKEKKRKNRIKQKIVSATPLIVTAIYLLLGFCFGAWHPGWVVFLAIPLMPMILYAFDGNFKKKFMNALTIILVFAYILVGVLAHIWHPTWVAFFLIPICSIFIDEK